MERSHLPQGLPKSSTRMGHGMPSATDATGSPAPAHIPAGLRRLGLTGFLLGFGLGGFFDGILLHQVLQWHHLLSGVDCAAVQDVQVQILADGLFHVLMYILAGAGLWLLWRSRGSFVLPGADRRLLAPG